MNALYKEVSHVLESGVLAASLLENACEAALESHDSLQLKVVRNLAGDLKDPAIELSGQGDYQNISPSGLLAETALRYADLANLAACNAFQFPSEHRPKAVAVTHLAAGTVRALVVLAGSGKPAPENDGLLRDTRSARWRADLAVRQVEEIANNS